MSLPGSSRSSPLLINDNEEILSPSKDNHVNIVEVPKEAMGFQRQKDVAENGDEEILSPSKDDNHVNIVEVPKAMGFQRQKDVAENGEQQKLHGKIGKEKERKEEEFPKIPNFSLELMQEEISEDIYGMTGKIPSRTLRKREKNVQKQIELIFPGGSLKAATVDKYKV